MNPELRAQLEQLDVWHLTLAAHEKNKASKQTEEEKRLAWKAYYEYELTKARGSKSNETDKAASIYVPHCFREIAAENGIYQTEEPSDSVPKVNKISMFFD